MHNSHLRNVAAIKPNRPIHPPLPDPSKKRQRVRNHGSLQSAVSSPRAGQSAASAQLSWDQEQRQCRYFGIGARCKDFVRESFGAGAQGWDDGAGGEVGCDEMNYSFESGTPVLVFACVCIVIVLYCIVSYDMISSIQSVLFYNCTVHSILPLSRISCVLPSIYTSNPK